MVESPFDLIWVAAFTLGCIILPMALGLIAILADRK